MIEDSIEEVKQRTTVRKLKEAITWGERFVNGEGDLSTSKIKLLTEAAAKHLKVLDQKVIMINKQEYNLKRLSIRVSREFDIKALAGIHSADEVFQVIKKDEKTHIVHVDKHHKLNLKGGESFFTQPPLGIHS